MVLQDDMLFKPFDWTMVSVLWHLISCQTIHVMLVTLQYIRLGPQLWCCCNIDGLTSSTYLIVQQGRVTWTNRYHQYTIIIFIIICRPNSEAWGLGGDGLKSPVLCLSHIKARKMGNALLMCTKKSSKSHSGYQQHALLEIDANAGRQSDTLLNPCRQKPLDMLHNPPYSMLQIRVWLLYRRPNCHIHQIPSSDIQRACCRCNNSMVSYKLHGFM